MKVYRLPDKVSALIFDMDLTLYSDPAYAEYQVDILIERLGMTQGLSLGEMKGKLEVVRQSWADSHGGKKPSLGNIILSYGISMEENVKWREEAFEPASFLKADPLLKKTLKELSHFFILGVVTNNPVLVAQKTLAVLGVGDYLPIVVGLDTSMVSKPHRLPFEIFTRLADCKTENCVSIGDRYDIDLDIPLEMGMGGILVEGVEDVYKLPELLASYRAAKNDT